MKFNTKTRYGLRTMIEMALPREQEGILQKDIAEKQDISFKYLDHVIAGLKSAGLIRLVAGKKSGYMLNRKPNEITTYDVFRAFNPELCAVDCLSGTNNCPRQGECASKGFWEGLNLQVKNYMQSISIAELAKKQLAYNTKTGELNFEI